MKTLNSISSVLFLFAAIVYAILHFIVFSFDTYFDPTTVKILPGQVEGTPIRMEFTGGPKKNFLGGYSVVIRSLPSNESVVDVSVGPFPYLVDRELPDPLLLSWWANNDSRTGLAAGKYSMHTCWTIYGRLNGWLPLTAKCSNTVKFEILPHPNKELVL